MTHINASADALVLDNPGVIARNEVTGNVGLEAVFVRVPARIRELLS